MAMAMELVPAALAVEPGRLGRMGVRLRNDGDEVRQVAVEVPPSEREWSWVHPESCPVAPGEEAEVVVFFKPSCGPHPPAGRHTVEIVARAPGDGVAAKGEGTVEVKPWVDAAGTLDPMVAYDQRAADYTLNLENRGNVPITATLGTDDPSGALDVDVQPKQVSAQPGETVTATVTVQARKKLKKGEQRYRVCVVAQVEGGSELRIEGGFRQQGVKGPK
ncbi:MAG: hypothetical protein M3203_06530 [Actinomycetota bacterium]|nr:hypothetical protein [Actinomycetota bacterium]